MFPIQHGGQRMFRRDANMDTTTRRILGYHFRILNDCNAREEIQRFEQPE
jgi:hypothetical protein